MEKYELVRDIGSGNFGVARLMRNKETKELVAMKYIERGHKVRSWNLISLSSSSDLCFEIGDFDFVLLLQIDENVAREIINHRSLRHPNIIRFKEVSFFFSDSSSLLQTGAVLLGLHGVLRLSSHFLHILQVVLTPTHLAIVMEFAAGGELFERICNAGRFSEDEVLEVSLCFL